MRKKYIAIALGLVLGAASCSTITAGAAETNEATLTIAGETEASDTNDSALAKETEKASEEASEEKTDAALDDEKPSDDADSAEDKPSDDADSDEESWTLGKVAKAGDDSITIESLPENQTRGHHMDPGPDQGKPDGQTQPDGQSNATQNQPDGQTQPDGQSSATQNQSDEQSSASESQSDGQNPPDAQNLSDGQNGATENEAPSSGDTSNDDTSNDQTSDANSAATTKTYDYSKDVKAYSGDRDSSDEIKVSDIKEGDMVLFTTDDDGNINAIKVVTGREFGQRGNGQPQGQMPQQNGGTNQQPQGQMPQQNGGMNQQPQDQMPQQNGGTNQGSL